MIGHIVLRTVCDQVTSLHVALSCSSVIDQLNSFRVTSSYNELMRFRISASSAVAKAEQGLAQFDSRNGLDLAQVVVDNFDTQI